MRKRFLFLLSFLMILAIASVGMAGEASTADRMISFAEESYAVYTGKQLKLNAIIENVSPSAPQQTQLTWTSSDQAVATVTANGTVAGKKAGKVFITAAAKDNEAVNAKVVVEVRVPVQSVQINEKNISVMVGGNADAAKKQLSVSIKPENAFFQTGKWTSSNNAIATVDSNGVVTGVNIGTASITFTSDDPNGTKKAQVNVKVGQAVTGIIAPAEEVVHVRKNLALRPEVLPKEAANKKLEYYSSDPTVAKVSPAGQVTGVSNGEATITCRATDGSGISAEIHVTVFQPVQSLKLSQNQLDAFAGKTSEPLYVIISPADAKYKDVTWSSSNNAIATVNEKGEVTGIAGGEVQITATSNEPVSGQEKPKSVSCRVKVSQAVEYIGLAKNEKKSTNRKLVLDLTVLPETATNKKVEWTTSDKKVATVKNGVVTIKKHEGSTIITAKAKDGSGIYATCEVTVGFSGIVMQIGSYVHREGAYTWGVDNFDGNGVLPEKKEGLIVEVPGQNPKHSASNF